MKFENKSREKQKKEFGSCNTTIINKIMNNIEKDYNKQLESKLDHNFLKNKTLELNDVILSIRNCISIDSVILDKIQKLSISKGGFLYSDYRKILYKKLFGVQTQIGKYFTSLIFKMSDEKFQNSMFEEHSDYVDEKCEIAHKEILERDVDRTVFSHLDYFSNRSDVCDDFNIFTIKKNLLIFLKSVLSLKYTRYDYFQGFHDFSLYIYLLYHDNSDGILILQRIIEMYLKDFLDASDKNSETIFHTVTLIIRETLKYLNLDIYEKLELEFDGAYASLMVSSIVCIFTHKIKKVGVCYRILDYVLCSHPITVYVLAVNILIDQYQKFSNDNEKSFLECLSNIDYSAINYDEIVEKTHKVICKSDYKNFIIDKFKNKLIRFSPLKINTQGPVYDLHLFMKKKENYNRNRDGSQNFRLIYILMLMLLLITVFIQKNLI